MEPRLNTYKQSSEVQECGSWDMRTDRHTDKWTNTQRDRHTYHNTLQWWQKTVRSVDANWKRIWTV